MKLRYLLLTFLLASTVRPAGLFLQMSDPQFGMYSENKDFAQETVNFEFAIATANRSRLNFVVICGDLINQAGNSAQTAEYHRIAAKLDPAIKLYNVAGNHDVGNQPTPASRTAYREKFGADYYRFRSGDLEGFVLNSSLIAAPEQAQAEAGRQEEWLKGELAKARPDGVRYRVIFQHHPSFLESADEPDQYFNIPLESRKKYLDLLLKYGVHDVFAGHYHRNALAQTDSLRMVTSGPVSKPLGADPSGIRVVIVRESTMESQYYGLGNIPNQVDLRAPAH